MKAFEYVNAQTPESAAELIGADGRYLAGGIDLLGEMKEYIATPTRVVNVKNLPATRGISKTPEGAFRLGANVTIAEVAAQADLPAGLIEAAAEVGSPQIRAVATVGGNLAQHSRCWYYRQRDLSCLKRGGSTCYAREGENKYNAIFTGNPCISPVVSNLAVALTVLGAQAVVWRKGKEVKLTMAELYADAWNNPLAQNSLQPGDLILAVEVPAPAAGARSSYLQVSEKSDFDWALVSCAAAGSIKDQKFTGVKIALGAVAPVPFQVEEANAFLEGKPGNEDSANAAAGLILAKATPFSRNGYKVPIARALIRRTLLNLAK
ncbi:MAG: FAD binding domain-containing protein [Terrimicrobiaceae bacterium]